MGSLQCWSPGSTATLRGVLNRVLWAYPTIVVEDTSSLVALYLPAGAMGKNLATRPTPQDALSPQTLRVVDRTWQRTDVLMLIIPGESFGTYLMWKTGTWELDCWYINLQDPLRRTAIGFDTADHTLDVVVSPDMCDWCWKDEDEFREATRIGLYSPDQAQGIRMEGERAIRLLTCERKSFYRQWECWRADPGWALPQLPPCWELLQGPLGEAGCHQQAAD